MIARKIQEAVAFRVLAGGNEPAHRTIAEFRQKHLKVFPGLLVQVVRIAQEAGLVKMGTLVVDGAKVRANASKRKAMRYKRMKEEDKRLEREIQELLKQAEAEDAREDELYGSDKTGCEVPEEYRRSTGGVPEEYRRSRGGGRTGRRKFGGRGSGSRRGRKPKTARGAESRETRTRGRRTGWRRGRRPRRDEGGTVAARRSSRRCSGGSRRLSSPWRKSDRVEAGSSPPSLRCQTSAYSRYSSGSAP